MVRETSSARTRATPGSGHRRWQSNQHPPAPRNSAFGRDLAPPGRGRRRDGGRLGRRGLRRQPERAGLQEGRGRFRRRRADRDPDRGHQRQRAVRKERRRTARALQHDEADDRRGGFSRHQAGRHQADRRIPHQRERLAPGRRALGHLDDVRGPQQQGLGRRPAARRASSRAATTPASRWPKASPATSAPSPPRS